MELNIGQLVPRLDTLIVVMDGGEGHATTAAPRLARLGYTEIAVLDGGAPARKDAGAALFPEIEVPATGFAAFTRINGQPNFISPHELDEALRSDEDWIVLDSRVNRELRYGNITGTTNVHGAELVRFFDDLVPESNTKVVVNCMNGTRGILGALSPVAAGVPNEIRALFPDTCGWLLDGYELEKNAARAVEDASNAARRAGADRARQSQKTLG
ncbi:MAG: rhodanese-related sulfurtransferase [Gammaproteobacteria bacterium]|jgi:rhodanese-related sulfurtransferase